MVDAQGFIFDFTRVKDFFDNWNILFKLSDMNTSNNFKLVFCSDSPPNIDECLNAGGGINTNVVTVADTVYCSLKWENETISIRNDTTWNIDGEVPLRAVFLVSNNYVMAYSINMSEFIVSNKIVFDEGTKLWSIYDE